MNAWRVGLIGCLVLLHAASAQARTIDAFAGGGGGSATHPGAAVSQFDVTTANSFPPGNDPTGRIGPVSGAMAELVVRLESLAGPAGAMVTMAINTSTADSLGKFRILADAGMEARTILTWDGFETPGLGLGGQDITDSPSGAGCAAPLRADRLVFAVLDGDANVQVDIAIRDMAGRTATLTRQGLAPGTVDFRYADFTDAATVDFTAVDAMTVVFSGVGVTLSLEEITTGCDPMDADGDGITDTQDACTGSNLSPTVMVGTCQSGVKNPLFPSGCSLRDLVAGCTTLRPGPARNCINAKTKALRNLDILTEAQRQAIRSCF